MAKASFGGAMALQSLDVLKNRKSVPKLTGTAAGFVGLGVSSVAAGKAFFLMGKAFENARKKR